MADGSLFFSPEYRDESCTLNKEISLPAERLLLASVKNTHLLATSFDVPRMRDFPYLIYADVAKGDYDYAMTTDHANQANGNRFPV